MECVRPLPPPGPQGAALQQWRSAPWAALARCIRARRWPPASPRTPLAPIPGPYGVLGPVRDLATGLALLHFPRDSANRSSRGPATARRWRPCPGNHDGMAVLTSRARRSHGGGQPRPEIVLVRNHERGDVADPIAAPAQYDTATRAGQGPGGGTTTLRFRGRDFVGARQSLGGTCGTAPAVRRPGAPG